MRRKAEPKAVLDASAVLAYLQREPGFEKVGEELKAGAVISTVNLAEVEAKVISRGLDVDAATKSLLALGLTPRPFTEHDARQSALIYPTTQPAGLSLGDRACLALGLTAGLDVMTADRSWKDLDIGVVVRFIR